MTLRHAKFQTNDLPRAQIAQYRKWKTFSSLKITPALQVTVKFEILMMIGTHHKAKNLPNYLKDVNEGEFL